MTKTIAKQHPHLVILTDPNDAGKSTLAAELLPRFGIPPFGSADNLERGLPGFVSGPPDQLQVDDEPSS